MVFSGQIHGSLRSNLKRVVGLRHLTESCLSFHIGIAGRCVSSSGSVRILDETYLLRRKLCMCLVYSTTLLHAIALGSLQYFKILLR